MIHKLDDGREVEVTLSRHDESGDMGLHVSGKLIARLTPGGWLEVVSPGFSIQVIQPPYNRPEQ